MIASLLRRFTIRTRMLGAIVMVLGMFALVGVAGLSSGMRLRSLNQDLIRQSTVSNFHVEAGTSALPA